MKKYGLAKKRLVDYVCIVGVDDFDEEILEDQTNNGGVRHTIKSPQLLRRFPEEDHDDFPLPLNVVTFCQPEGCFTIGENTSTNSNNHSKEFDVDHHDDDDDPNDNNTHDDFTENVHEFRVKDCNSFVFTLTDKDSNITTYGVCHNFYRKVYIYPRKVDIEDPRCSRQVHSKKHIGFFFLSKSANKNILKIYIYNHF